MRKKRDTFKFVTHLIVFSLLVVLTGKVIFSDLTKSVPLYAYGIIVSFVTLNVFFFTFVKYKDPYELAKLLPEDKKKKFFVTCLVAVHNEEDVIESCIQSVLNQTYPYKEIIFIDDKSTDRTLEKMMPYAEKGLIKVIALEKNVMKKRALGAGMLQAKGDIYAFSDSDSVWAPDALEKCVEIFNLDENIGAVSGHCRALNGDLNIWTKVQDSWYEGQFSIRKAFESIFGAVTCVSGPLAVFRKEAIYNYIPAWENDQFLGQEFKFATDRTLTGFVLGSKQIEKKLKEKYKDSPFVTSVNYPARTWKIVYCKSAKAWTNVPDSFKRIMKQQIRWKKSFIRNMCFTGTFYWRRPLLPAFNYYAHIIFVWAGPLISFRHLVYIPLKGDWLSAILYLAGIVFVGFMFGLAFKLENRDSHKWIYRPLMSLFSTLVLSWVIYYSAATVKKMIWARA